MSHPRRHPVPTRLKRLVRAAEAAGWSYDTTKGSHPRLSPPAGLLDPRTGSLQAPVTFALTPSDVRGDRNSAAVLKRHGIEA